MFDQTLLGAELPAPITPWRSEQTRSRRYCTQIAKARHLTIRSDVSFALHFYGATDNRTLWVIYSLSLKNILRLELQPHAVVEPKERAFLGAIRYQREKRNAFVYATSK